MSMNLFTFAYCGTQESFDKTLDYLASIAEDEKWSFDGGEHNSILKSYINKTFSQCYAQSKILYTEKNDYACFNTGLMTKNGQDIIAIFDSNRKPEGQPWHLKCFKDVTDRFFMNLFSRIPEIATYITDFEELYFDPSRDIAINIDHIMDDNWERIKSAVPLSRSLVMGLLSGAVINARERVRRNMRLVIPQFYNDRIMYLMPIQFPIDDNNTKTMALAIERTENGQYRANTIFTTEMAYEKARLLMKPESNWLI